MHGQANLDSNPGPNVDCGQVENLIPEDGELDEGDLEGGQGVLEGGGQSSTL